MKFLKRFFLIFAILICCIFALWLVDSSFISASAVTPDVTLSAEQTLALYGNTIAASYSDNDSLWSSCQFVFRGFFQADSSDIYDTDLRSSPPAYMSSMLGTTQYLVYTCNDFVPSSVQNVRFDVDFTLDISGIARFHQLLLYSISPVNGHQGTVDLRYDFCANTVSYSATPVTVNPFYFDISQYRNWVQFYATSGPVWFLTNPKFSITEVLLHDVDVSTGDENDFTITGQNLQWHNPDYYAISGDISSTPGSFVLYIGCPIVTDGYILPEPPETTPNYNSRLDTIIDVTSSNNSLLAQILAKLDLIYQAMQQGESSPTLQDPEKIGFDSRTKQEILDGVHGAASMLDSQNIPEGVSDVAGAVWSVSDGFLDCVPGLAGIYTFIFVLGFVSWVLYGKRGG